VARRQFTVPTWYRQAIVAAAVGLVLVIAAAGYWELRPPVTKDGAGGIAAIARGAGDTSAQGLRLCNRTPSRVGVAIGYKSSQQWITEGWWNVAPDSCETLVPGTLVSRFYYVYAVDYDRGGIWGGKAAMCTSDKSFTIRGIEDCVTRGYERNNFVEVDTGEQTSWTVQLTEPGATDDSASLGG
jgi:uncharacterized membrane protein